MRYRPEQIAPWSAFSTTTLVSHTAQLFLSATTRSCRPPLRVMPTSKMPREHFVNTPSHNDIAFLILICGTYIFLVSTIPPLTTLTTFVFCIGTIFLSIQAPWLDYQLPPPNQKQAAVFGLQHCEEVQLPAGPSIHESETENGVDGRLPFQQSRDTDDHHVLGQETSVTSEQGPSMPSENADPLAAVHEKLLRIQQRNRDCIARLAETQALFDEHREKTRRLKAECAKTRVGMLLSPLQNPSLLQQQLRLAGRGPGNLWGTIEV